MKEKEAKTIAIQQEKRQAKQDNSFKKSWQQAYNNEIQELGEKLSLDRSAPFHEQSIEGRKPASTRRQG
ncbi:hypothetical protein CCACVL1_20247 [Corchorus capsularis]|uniref:Uncharacterized protein n=1 Tax=Corchorus capsularis TaxID=210143 RepID=A0A1R3HC40_COCAP|nr:hypothetical protein CCACVL1_20247 [Corchorus capsularis]